MKINLEKIIQDRKKRILKTHEMPITDIKVLEFMKHHKLDKNLFYNAKGLPINQIKREMLFVDALFAYNTTPCEKGRHTIRDRNGHCIQCRTANIAFQKRSHKSGYIYIAGSIEGQLIKIGSTNSIEKRENSLKKSKYAGCQDWEILFYIFSNRSGLFEFLTICKLSKYITKKQYFKEGKPIIATEIFYCNFKKAYDAIMRTKDHSHNFVTKSEKLFDHKIKKYAFRNLI